MINFQLHTFHLAQAFVFLTITVLFANGRTECRQRACDVTKFATFFKNDKCIYIGCSNSITLVRLAGGSGAYPVSVEGNVMSRDLFKNGVQ